MPRPNTPHTIDSIRLTADQQSDLDRLIDICYKADSLRDAELVLRQAVGAFKKKYRLAGSRFIKKPYVFLGGGAVLQVK